MISLCNNSIKIFYDIYWSLSTLTDRQSVQCKQATSIGCNLYYVNRQRQVAPPGLQLISWSTVITITLVVFIAPKCGLYLDFVCAKNAKQTVEDGRKAVRHNNYDGVTRQSGITTGLQGSQVLQRGYKAVRYRVVQQQQGSDWQFDQSDKLFEFNLCLNYSGLSGLSCKEPVLFRPRTPQYFAMKFS